MAELAGVLAIGFVAGVLSGMFGIGGGVIMVPAMTLLLGLDGLEAIGTSLPVIIPSAIAGAYSYLRAGVADLRGGLRLGIAGAPVAVIGAWLAEKAGGTVVLIVLAAVVLYTAADTLVQTFRPLRPSSPETCAEADLEPSLPWSRAGAVGGATGLYSGFLGLGGGFIMVPMLRRFGRFPIKRAIGTSLVAIILLALPGSVSHALLGNADLELSALLALGVVPGALLGARVTIGASERWVRFAFACMLIATGAALMARETGLL